jgi:hypothetical protein
MTLTAAIFGTDYQNVPSSILVAAGAFGLL